MIYQVKQREAELRGRQEQAKKMALNLNSLGVPIDKIAKAAEVSISTVQEWLSEPLMTPAK